MSSKGRVAVRLGVDASVRRRIDITRLFTQRPEERLTLHDVCGHTPGPRDRVRELLEELVATGWLRTEQDADNRVVYWRDDGERRA